MLPREEIFAIIHNIEGKYYVEMPNKLHVFMKDHNIEIMAGLRYKGMGAGLCGTYDGERMFDLQGPKHCLYDDQHHELFYKSYVSEETDCPNFAAWKDEVKQFQAQCTKSFTHDYQPAITHNYFCKYSRFYLLYIQLLMNSKRYLITTSETNNWNYLCSSILVQLTSSF